MQLPFTRYARASRCLLAAAALASLSVGSQAAVVLVNGSFETTGASFSPVIGGLNAASGWTHLSGLNIQAASALPGFEGEQPAGATGLRYLRLASDAGANNIGFIGQNMGTMVAGERYDILGDVLGGNSTNTQWAATFSLSSDLGLSPATVYATQHIGGITVGVNAANAISLSYTATAGDQGQPLFLWMRADASSSGTARRGGVDNLRLTVTPSATIPEPGSLALAGLALLVAAAAAARRPGQR
jgi:PEP-CTERM motif